MPVLGVIQSSQGQDFYMSQQKGMFFDTPPIPFWLAGFANITAK
jgi:hypothetical protein